jgi:outer membrane usher protein
MWCRLALVTIVYLTISAGAIAAPPAKPLAPAECWLAVRLNGEDFQDAALFLRLPDGHLLAPASQLRSWRLRAPAHAAVSYQGEQYAALDALPGLSYQVDEDNQILIINAPANLFDHTTLKGMGRDYVSVPPSPFGGYLNYDWVAANAAGHTSISGSLEASVFGPAGAGVVSYLEKHYDQQTQSIRLDSTWTIDRPATADTFKIGDSITGASAWWGSAVRFGGIQWSSNYTTQPGLITMPLPSVAGETAVPSTLDLYVNDALRLQNNVQAGHFLVDDIPVVTGDGEIRLVVRDLLGREQVITEPYYASPSLLRAGLHEDSFETGFTRDNYGVLSNDYGRPLAVATDRMGLTDQLTGEIHGEALPGQQTLGIAGALLLSTFGVLSASIAGSHSERGIGHLMNLGFQRSARWLSYGATVEYASQSFERLGLLPGESIPHLTSQAYAIAGLGRFGSLSVSRTREEFYNAHTIEIASARESINVGRLGYLTLSAIKTLDATRDTTIALNLTHSLDARTSATATVTSDSTGSDAELDVQRNLPAGPGIGYRLVADTGETRAVDATLDVQGNYGAYEVEAREQPGATLTQVAASGGLAFLAGHLFPTRQIDDSFAVVEVGNERDVRIYRENQLVGQTDSQGYLLVPGLRAYQNNSIRVEQADLPLDVTVDAMQVQAVPYSRSGVFLNFPVDRPRGALLSVLLESGDPLPPGAQVHMVGREEMFPSGLRGEVYVTGLADDNRLHADWGAQSCEFTMSFTQSSDPLPRLGPYVCKRIAP